MPRFIPLLLLFCVSQAKADDLEIKYNLVGPAFPRFAEHGLEIEYFWKAAVVPFLRFALINRDYGHESWAGEKIGRSSEEGYRLWVGNKARLIPWRFLTHLETLLFYRYSDLRFAHAGRGWATGDGKERVHVNAIGAGLSFNVAIGKWIVVEPFWYGDYGQYKVASVSGNTAPYSPYAHTWDDEHRVGLNLGMKF